MPLGTLVEVLVMNRLLNPQSMYALEMRANGLVTLPVRGYIPLKAAT